MFEVHVHSVVVFDEELVVVSAFQTSSLIEELAMKAGDVGVLLDTESAGMTQLRHQGITIAYSHL